MPDLKFLPSILLPMCFVAHGLEPASQASVEIHSRQRPDAVISDSKLTLAQQWGLKDEELERYHTLMQGPLGTYSPNLDPLSALGIEAHTEAERRRYARLQVDAEAARVEKLLVYQRAYDQAWKDLHPKLALVNTPPESSPLMSRPIERKAVFVRYDCSKCLSRVSELLGSGVTFDLFVVDTQQDDGRIRRWAQSAGITSHKVRNGSITINHDNGRWESMGAPGELPAVMHKVNGKWGRQ